MLGKSSILSPGLNRGFPLSVALEQVSYRPFTFPDGRQCRRPSHRTAPRPSGPRASARPRRTVATLHTHHDLNRLRSPSLCNLLQPDRFEEDLQISGVRLRATLYRGVPIRQPSL
jgi:hypothetical protein